MLRKYEVLVLLKPNLSEQAQQALISKIEVQLGGTIIKKEDWGLKLLAYKIKKFEQAHYLLYYVETESKNIIEFRKMSLITLDILRNLIIHHEKEWPFNLKTTRNLEFPDRNNYRGSKYQGKKRNFQSSEPTDNSAATNVQQLQEITSNSEPAPTFTELVKKSNLTKTVNVNVKADSVLPDNEDTKE